VTSSIDFCNSTRRTDSPRDSFVPRTCAGRSQTRSPLSRLRAAPISCERAPAGGTELEDSLSFLPAGGRGEQSPDSTRPEHPVVTDACVRALGRPSLPHPPKAHLARPPREGRTRCSEPECFPSPGSSSLLEDRSSRVVRPVSLGVPSEEGRGRANAFFYLSRSAVLDGVGTCVGFDREGLEA